MNSLLVLFAAAVAAGPASAASPCGAISFEGGVVKTAKPLSLAKPEGCLKAIASELKKGPAIQTLTVSARVADGDRAGGKALAAAKTAAALLVAGGIAQERVSAVAPRVEAGEPTGLFLSYTERPAAKVVGRVLAASSEALAGESEDTLAAVTPGTRLRVGHFVRTGPAGSIELQISGGATVSLLASTEAQLVVREEKGEPPLVRFVLRSGELVARGGPVDVKHDGVVARVASGEGRVRTAPGGELRAEVVEGAASLYTKKGRQELTAGRASRAVATGEPDAPRRLLDPAAVRSPIGGQHPRPPALSWTKEAGAASYLVQLSRTADFGSSRLFASAADSLTPDALDGGKWYWRVHGVDAEGFVGRPSKILSFELPTPAVASPAGAVR